MKVYTFPEPPLLNRLYRIGNGRIYKAVTANKYRSELWALCKSYRIKPTSEELELHLSWYRQRNAGDIDAILKSLLDGLERLIWVNDKQIRVLVVRKFVDKFNPRVEVCYTKFGGPLSLHPLQPEHP